MIFISFMNEMNITYIYIYINANMYKCMQHRDIYIYIYKLLNILKLLNPMHYRKFISVGMETPKPFW